MSKTLEEAQRDLAAYKPTTEDDALVKSLLGIEEDLETLVKSDAKGDPETEGTDGDNDESDDTDDTGDTESDDDDEGDESDDNNAPPPAKQPMGKSYTGAGAQFAKSMVLDDDGRPSAFGEMIEVSDVLTHMTDTLAKSLGDQQTEIGAVQLQNDRTYELVKAIGQAVISLRKDVTALKKSLSEGALTKSQTVQPTGREPFAGMYFAGSRRTPTAPIPGEGQPLTKGYVTGALLTAAQTGKLDREIYNRAALTLDSSGIDAALELLPADVAEGIRTGGSY